MLLAGVPEKVTGKDSMLAEALDSPRAAGRSHGAAARRDLDDGDGSTARSPGIPDAKLMSPEVAAGARVQRPRSAWGPAEPRRATARSKYPRSRLVYQKPPSKSAGPHPGPRSMDSDAALVRSQLGSTAHGCSSILLETGSPSVTSARVTLPKRKTVRDVDKKVRDRRLPVRDS